MVSPAPSPRAMLTRLGSRLRLSGLVDNAPEGTGAPVVDLAAERERRGR